MTGVILAAVAVGLGAAAQAVTGFGFSLVSAPFLVAAASAPRGVEWNLVLSAGLNLALLLACGRRRVRWGEVARMLGPAVVVTVPLGYVARHADRGPLTVAAGALCLGATVAAALGLRASALAGRGGALAAGGLSGAMNVVAGIGGPPVVIYGLNAGWPAAVWRPTMQAFFLGINLVAIPSLGLAAPPWSLPVAGVGGMAAGLLASRRLPDRAVRWAVLAVAAAGGGLAVARGLGA